MCAGCSTPTIGLTSASKTAETIGHIKPSPKDTCETQRQVAAQSSRIDSIVKGAETVYKAACEPNASAAAAPPKSAPASKPAPKTS